MGSRRLEITVVSAENLPDMHRLGRMKTYAMVSLDGTIDTTNVDKKGDTCPTWNFPFVYNIKETDLYRPGLDVMVDLFSEKTLGEDKLIGRVVIPVKDLFEKGLESQRSLGYPIAGTAYGRLYIRYCFEDKNLVPERSEPWGRRDFTLTKTSFYSY